MSTEPGHDSTVLVDRYKRAAHLGAPTSNAYKGLRIHALPGLHEFVGQRAKEHFKAGGSLLDLAAGSGAMSQRMRDMGFAVCATDYVTENFRLHESIPFVQANLNEEFSARYVQKFDGIVASEIIEHIENPRHFARECFKLLAPGGRIVVSTPNVDSAASKASFIRSGAFLWFDERDYIEQGHITPLSQSQLHRAFAEAGFTTLWLGSFGNAKGKLGGSPRLQLLARLVALLANVDRHLDGEILVSVMERPGADPVTQ